MAQPTSPWPTRVLWALAILVVMAVAFLAGMLTERIRFDARRDEMLRRYDRALQQHQQQIMRSEQATENVKR